MPPLRFFPAPHMQNWFLFIFGSMSVIFGGANTIVNLITLKNRTSGFTEILVRLKRPIHEG
jgi:hypothetical protein